ncbi:MAG: NUDIX domain-containing protein [Chloroflexota bacterium]
MSNNYQFCPFCGTQLIQEWISGATRPHCPQCEFTQFYDPKVSVIGLITHNDKLLLTQRAVDPAKGQWALPGGYMDAGEMPKDALQRELLEEVGLHIQIVALHDIYPMIKPEAHGRSNPGIVIVYHAIPQQVTPDGKVAYDDTTIPPLKALDDVCDARWFVRTDIPDNLAFESTKALLSLWQNDQLQL